jgi:hypothetical protein
LVLVALLVGFAKGASDESVKLVDASKAAALLTQGCSDKETSTACNQAKLNQALDTVKLEQQRVGDLGTLNQLQAAAGGFVLLGFLLGIAGILTNPVPGPDTKHNEPAPAGGPVPVGTKQAWKHAVGRLSPKKVWIILSLVAQAGAVVLIVTIGVNVLT